MTHRPEIDGLRAVAVMPVILFHAELGPLSGGFIGVDIFFVISGYLITRLLLWDLDAGTFNIVRFYERRARRILPALFLVVAVCIPFAVLWMFPRALNDFFQSVVATTVFSSNILFWLESGYFSSASDVKPLLHTWSLAIEEQFYIVFPVVLAVLWRGPGRFARTLLCCAGVALISFALAVGASDRWPDAAFYLLPTRMWELLAGALCALVLHRYTLRPSSVGGGLGLALITVALFTSTDSVWPSWMTLLPVCGTALIILFATSQTSVGRVLSCGPLVGIGLVSYSAYLWHQPVLVFAQIRLVDSPSVEMRLGLLALVGVLAFLTWKYVEQPFRAQSRGGPRIPRRTVFMGSMGGAAVLTAVALAGDLSNGFPGRTAPSGRDFTQITDTLAAGRFAALPCDTDITFLPVHRTPKAECVFQASAPVSQGQRAILIGDSHAGMLSHGVKTRLLAAGYDVSIMTYGGCMPVPGYRWPGRDCHAANTAVYDHLEQESYDLILVAGRFQLLLSDMDRLLLETTATPGPDAGRALIRAGLRRLMGLDGTVLVFDPIPEMPMDIGEHARKRYAFEPTVQAIDFDHPYAAYLDRAGPVLSVLDEMQSDPGLIRLHSADMMCDRPKGVCHGINAGAVLYVDDNHLSSAGVARLMPALDRALDERATDRLAAATGTLEKLHHHYFIATNHEYQ